MDDTLAWIQAHAAPGGAVTFDYQDQAGVPDAPERHSRLYALLSRFSSEQRDFGIDAGQIKKFLARRGFIHVVL